MVLASVWATAEPELRADLQQTYGIDLDHATSGEHSPYHVACLVEFLPQDARLRVSKDADCVWTLDRILCASVLNSLNSMISGLGGGGEPALIGPKWLTERGKRKLPAMVLSIDELLTELNKPRTENPRG